MELDESIFSEINSELLANNLSITESEFNYFSIPTFFTEHLPLTKEITPSKLEILPDKNANKSRRRSIKKQKENNALEIEKRKLVRIKTIFKKAKEISTLCNLQVAVVLLDKKRLKTFYSSDKLESKLKSKLTDALKSETV